MYKHNVYNVQYYTYMIIYKVLGIVEKHPLKYQLRITVKPVHFMEKATFHLHHR